MDDKLNQQKSKMLAGELYDASDAALSRDRLHCRSLVHEMNHMPPNGETTGRICRELFGSGGDSVLLEPPFRCDYGTNIYLGKHVYFNFDCVILDVCEVRIGDNVFFGPGVHIYTATHPLEAMLRRTQEFGKPVSIGNDVWIGGRAIICPGVSIGDRTVVGAGSVVTKSVASDVLVAGNPAKTIRELKR